MKKSISILLVVLMVIAVGLTGCGGASTTNLILATGGTSGTYYPYGGAIAQVWNDNLEGMNVTAQSSGASAENLKLLASGDADLAIVQNDTMYYAFKGIETFADGAITGYSAMAALYPEIVQLVVRPDAGINTIADLKGKKVSLGDAGSGTEINATQILAAYGLSVTDIKATNLSFSDSASAYKDKQIDAFFVTAGLPNSAIQEVCATDPIRMLSVEGTALESLLADYPFYSTYTIPGGTYKGQDSDVTALAIKAVLAVSDKLSEETVYNLTKALFDNQAALATGHAKGAELNITSAQEGIPIPYHPGAQKFYDEQ